MTGIVGSFTATAAVAIAAITIRIAIAIAACFIRSRPVDCWVTTLEVVVVAAEQQVIEAGVIVVGLAVAVAIWLPN